MRNVKDAVPATAVGNARAAPLRPRPESSQPLSPPDPAGLFPPADQRHRGLAATGTTGVPPSPAQGDEKETLRAETLHADPNHDLWPPPPQTGTGKTPLYRQLRGGSQFLETTPQFANTRTPVLNPVSINSGSLLTSNSINPDDGYFSPAGDLPLKANKGFGLPNSKPSTFTAGSISPSVAENDYPSLVNEILTTGNMFGSFNWTTVLERLDNAAAKDMVNVENVANVNQAFGGNRLLGKPLETNGTMRAVLSSTTVRERRDMIYNSTKTATQLKSDPVEAEGAPFLPNDYAEIHDNFLTLYFRTHGMNATRGLGRRLPMRMTEVEKRYLAMPALTDISFVPDENRSKVMII